MTRRILIAAALLASVAVLAALARVNSRPAGPIATVDTLRLMERMLEMPEFADARNTKIEELQTPLMDLDTRLRTMIGQLEQMDQTTPEFAQLNAQARQINQQLVQSQQNAQLEIDAFAAEQFATAFQRVRAATSEIAERDGYDYVATSRFDDQDIITSSTSLFAQEIMYRSILVAPEGTDITETVAEALSLPEATDETPSVMPSTEPAPTPDP